VAIPENPAVPDPTRPSGNPREALGIGLAFLGLVALGSWWAFQPSPVVDHLETSRPAGPEPDYASYVGDAACSRCHPGESASHSRSGHARTLVPVARSAITRGLVGKRFDDPERPEVAWDFAFEDGKLFARRTEEGRVDRLPVEYAFGSGHHATTFVSLVDRDPAHPVALEHRLTYFAHAKSTGLTPGQSAAAHALGTSPTGRVHTSSDTLKCFACHATATSSRGRGELDEATMIPNVSCESCHGPGRSHVEAARRGAGLAALKMPQSPGTWTAAEQMEQCGKCHRTPEMVTPGGIRPDNPALVRHQPVGLVQSTCYLRSQGALSCVTCHDPHARASTDRPSYEASCLSCHQGPTRTPCPVSPSNGCIDCHMPRREVGRGMMMTDHWIRRKP
jgi:hypothetical protein